MYLNANLSALQTESALSTTWESVATAENALETGTTQNVGNPSSLPAEADQLSSQATIASQSLRNLQQGTDMLQTAMGGTQSTIALVEQLQTLAVQATDSALGANATASLQAQVHAVLSQIDAIAATTTYGPTVLTAQNHVVYSPVSGATVQSLAGGPGMAPGSYSMVLTDQGSYLDATLQFNGVTVATGTAINPWVAVNLNANAWTGDYGGATVSNAIIAGESALVLSLPEPSEASSQPIAPLLITPSIANESLTLMLDSATAVHYVHPDLVSSGLNCENAGSTLSVGWQAINESDNGYNPSTNTINLNIVNNDASTSVALTGALMGYGTDPTHAHATITWSSVAAGFTGSALTVGYNAEALDVAPGQSVTTHFIVSPSAVYVGNPMASIAITPAVLTTEQLGLQNLSVQSPNAAQQAMRQADTALQILNATETQMGAQADALATAQTTARTTATQATMGAAAITAISLPEATQQLSHSMLLTQTGLQLLARSETLVLKMASILAL